MKLLIAIAISLASLGTGVGPTFAVDPPKVPPKGIEGPNVRAHGPPASPSFRVTRGHWKGADACVGIPLADWTFILYSPPGSEPQADDSLRAVGRSTSKV